MEKRYAIADPYEGYLLNEVRSFSEQGLRTGIAEIELLRSPRDNRALGMLRLWGGVSCSRENGRTTPFAHPIAQLSDRTCSNPVDGVDEDSSLNRVNATAYDAVDRLPRSLKVATRVRIPLGLQSELDPV